MNESTLTRPVIETLATGDEVVGGDIADTNSAFVSQLLTRRGLLVSRHTALPDDRDALLAGLRSIAGRADVCICSGGLGPTEDDLTADVAASMCGVEVVIDETAVARMKARFHAANYRFSENNRRSARVPLAADVFQNEVGTAPAFALAHGRCRFFFLPGVPREFRFFVDEVVLPWCEARWHGGFAVVSQLKTLGWGESHLAELFADYPVVYPRIKVGYRAHSPEVWLKLTAEAQDISTARAILAPALADATQRLGAAIFGHDDETLDGIVHRLLLETKQSLVTAESCTGGRIAALLTQHAGSSGYLLGGVVAYSNAMKSTLLGVDPLLIEAQGAVSRPVAEAMARGALQRTGAELAVAVTGIAGPGGATATKPLGLVYMALATQAKGEALTLERHFRGDRDRVQRAATLTALEMLRRHLMGLGPLTDGAS